MPNYPLNKIPGLIHNINRLRYNTHMPKKKVIKKKQYTSALISIRIFFYLFFIVGLLLFYPGTNYYVDVFAFNRELFTSTNKLDEQFAPQAVPYVRDTNITPFISAQGVYIIDLATATPLFEKNKDTKFFPASTTKVITALTARDVYKLDDVLTVRRVITEGQLANLVLNEKLTLESLLYATLIHSGNDAAYVLADNDPMGHAAFMNKMNAKARSIGMQNSQFTNPAGLDESAQFSTPYDLSLAGRKLLQDKELSKIVSTKSITISDIDFNNFHALYNVNQLLGKIPGVGGLKTGKTELAGENLITLYKRDNHEYLIVLMKSEDRFKDTEAIVNWIQTNISFENLH
ncbi:MAG: D-alanyl-D-alanine carboxypeptidase DacB precursor [Microgenomates bacterium OLB23]|nr:MAG: D-alanyl-D-alanine carboxypeptidase DacB precursor [Microgenomates bacterium OLB23]